MNEENQKDHLDIKFAAECDNGTICNSNLSIHINVTNFSTVSHYVIGSQSDIVLNIIVGNTGDPAYSTNAIISMPSYIKLSNGPPTCDDSNGKTKNRTVVECLISERLIEGTPVSLNFNFTYFERLFYQLLLENIAILIEIWLLLKM